MADPGDRSGDVYTADVPTGDRSDHGHADINGKDPGHQVQQYDGYHLSRGGKDEGGPSREIDGWHITNHDNGSHSWRGRDRR